MDLKEIKAVIDLMTKNGLTEFELEKGDVKLRVKRGPSGEWSTATLPIVPAGGTQALPPILVAPAPAAPAAASTPADAGGKTSPSPEAGLATIVSPMVGTFYRSPSPDSPPYIQEGQDVTEETVVCIIEAMKVMNEIKAECKGEIVKILVANSESVEYGQPLFHVKTA